MGKPKARNPFNADEYAKLTGLHGKWRDSWWRHDFLALIIKRAGIQDAQSLLDVGCGFGHWGRMLSRHLSSDLHLTGVDIEQTFVDKAATLGAEFGLTDIDYKVGYGEDLPCGDDTFDVVTSQTTLIQVQDPALVLCEMKRVLKPGGTVLLAEPDGLAGYFSTLQSVPNLDWCDLVKLLDCCRICTQGKKNLGFGDSTLGERLPGMVTGTGFEDVDVAINEKTPALFPPYDTELRQLQAAAELGAERRMPYGTRDNVLRFFKAGGGDEATFEPLWELAAKAQQLIKDAVKTGTYSAGRGGPMYIIWGRKPK